MTETLHEGVRKMSKPEIRFNGFDGEWEEKKINEISEINPHSELPVQFEYVDLESVSGTEIISHRTEFKETAPSRAQRLAKKGDVFYQTVRPYQKNNYFFNLDAKNYVFSTGYAQLRTNLNGHFLLSILQSNNFVQNVLENCTGTSYPAINPTTLGNLKVSFPDNAEQKKLGALFAQIDSLIASTQKELDKLVSLKKCMLQKMFPKKGSLVPEIRFKGFSGNWEEKKLGEIFRSISNAFVGTASPYYVENGHFYLESNNVKNGQINRNSEIFINDEFYYNQRHKWLHENDIVMVQSGHVGHSAVIPKELDNTAAHALIIFTDKYKTTDSYFINYSFMTSISVRQIEGITKGNTIKHILSSDMKNFIISIPNDYEEQQKIGSYFQNLDNLISKQSAELEKLKNVKKTLLSKMFV